MATRSTIGLVLLLALSFLIGCGSQPIPVLATEGTTIAIAVPPAFEMGYGRVLSSIGPLPDPADVQSEIQITGPPLTSANVNSDREDLQRGEIVAILVEDDGLGGVTPVATLPVRLRAHVEIYGLFGIPGDKDTPIVLLDIPLSDHDGNPIVSDSAPDGERLFAIEFRRYRRNDFAANATSFEYVPQSAPSSGPWYGWGNDENSMPPELSSGNQDPTRGVPLRVRDADGTDTVGMTPGTEVAAFTPHRGWDWVGSFELAWGGSQHPATPPPEFHVSPGTGFARAWEAAVSIPSDRVRITRVRPVIPGPTVLFSAPDEEDCSSGNTPRDLKIQFVSAVPAATDVVVSYAIKPDVVGCAGANRLASNDVSVANDFKAYDVDGTPLTVQFGISGRDFN